MPRPGRAKIVEDEGELGENAKKNKIYEDFLVFRAGNENFINKASQTINDAPKTKHTQTQWTPGQFNSIHLSNSFIEFIHFFYRLKNDMQFTFAPRDPAGREIRL